MYVKSVKITLNQVNLEHLYCTIRIMDFVFNTLNRVFHSPVWTNCIPKTPTKALPGKYAAGVPAKTDSIRR
jgi:hypothetical protein